MGSHEKKHNIQGGGGVKSEAKEQKKAKGRVLLRRERGDGWEAGSYRDDDALSCSRNNTHFVMNENSHSF